LQPHRSLLLVQVEDHLSGVVALVEALFEQCQQFLICRFGQRLVVPEASLAVQAAEDQALWERQATLLAFKPPDLQGRGAAVLASCLCRVMSC
jgi:hypothetical protein